MSIRCRLLVKSMSIGDVRLRAFMEERSSRVTWWELLNRHLNRVFSKIRMH